MSLMQRERIRKLSRFLRDTFGRRVHKVGLWGGFNCPNRNGTLGSSGCSFCNPLSARPASWREGMSVQDQLEAGCRYISERYRVSAFLPYFQDYTTTYGEPSELLRIYSGVLSYPGVAGLSLCTRPDCLEEPVLDLLQELSGRTFLWVELGVQTFDDDLLLDMNRCHTAADSLRAFELLHERGIRSAAHMILGYPGSTPGTVMNDAGLLRGTGTAGVKLQNFHVVRDTPMEARFRYGEFRTMDMREYADMAIRFLEYTDPGTVVMRLSGQAPPDMTVAPAWSLDRTAVLNAISEEMEKRDTWQGKGIGSPVVNLEMSPAASGLESRHGTIAAAAPPE